jgi:hypothetical protein
VQCNVCSLVYMYSPQGVTNCTQLLVWAVCGCETPPPTPRCWAAPGRRSVQFPAPLLPLLLPSLSTPCLPHLVTAPPPVRRCLGTAVHVQRQTRNRLSRVCKTAHARLYMYTKVLIGKRTRNGPRPASWLATTSDGSTVAVLCIAASSNGARGWCPGHCIDAQR